VLTQGKRGERNFMGLQAYVDDSGSEPQSAFFVLGGFIARSDQWGLFADEWKAALHRAPRIAYFKLNEAVGLKKQFDRELGWDTDKRDRKIDDLVDVILKYARVRIHATIRHDEFESYFRSIPAPKRHLAIENPYVLLAMQLILAVAAWSPIHKIFEPCDFIFDDQQTFGDALVEWYPGFRRTAFARWHRTDLPLYIGKPPKFQNDKSSMPLQAADLYAGLIRRHCDSNKLIMAPMPRLLRRLAPILEIPRNYMKDELKRLDEHLQREGQRFYAANPTARRLHKRVKRKSRN
jgi:hypothetical protein